MIVKLKMITKLLCPCDKVIIRTRRTVKVG